MWESQHLTTLWACTSCCRELLLNSGSLLLSYRVLSILHLYFVRFFLLLYPFSGILLIISYICCFKYIFFSFTAFSGLFQLRINFWKYWSFRHSVELLGQEVGILQGPYQHRTTQTQKNPNKHPGPKWDSNQWFQCSSSWTVVTMMSKYIYILKMKSIHLLCYLIYHIYICFALLEYIALFSLLKF
jgi:hypothetical protein